MRSIQFNEKIQRLFQILKQHRFLTLGFIVGTLIFSIVFIGIIGTLLPLYSLPQFSLSSFLISRVEKDTIYADFSLNLSEPVENNIIIEQIDCQLYHENSSGKLTLAKGKTLYAFTVPKEKNRVENISFKFEVPVLKDLLEALMGGEKIGIKGRIFFPLRFSTAFSYQPQEIGKSLFPNVTIIEIHPVPPGSQLEILVEVHNPHKISLNITEGFFHLFAEEYGFIGNVTITDVSMNPGRSNIKSYLEANTPELIWLFERILNNGTVHANIQNFEAILNFAEQNIDLYIEKGPMFLWQSYSAPIQILDVENISLLHRSFDISFGLLGEPLWGYNITTGCNTPWGISLDFYHKLIFSNEPRIVGNGSTTETVLVNRRGVNSVNIHITVFPSALEMLVVWISEQKIDIDIRNGLLCIQFYEVTFQVGFNKTL